MKTNIGQTDQIVRTIIAVVIFCAGLYFESWWGLLGLLPLLSALTRYCPLYTLMGLDTIEDEDYIPPPEVRRNFHLHTKP